MAVNINIDRSDVISIMALLMSLGAIFVALKQTTILKEQQKIMATQQEGSVWPHLDYKILIDTDSATFKMELNNKGIGPAIVTNFLFNEEYQSNLDLISLMEMLREAGMEQILDINFEHPTDKTIPAGDKISIVNFKIGASIENTIKLAALGNEFSKPKIYYESLYKTKYCEGCE